MSLSNPYFSAWLDAPDEAVRLRVVRATGGRDLTGADMRHQVRSLAAGLVEAGVRPGDIVLLFLSHQIRLIPAFFAVQLCGAVPSYMPPLSPRQDRAAYLASHSQVIAHVRPRLILADPEVAALLDSEAEAPILSLDAVQGEAEKAPVAPAFDPAATCLLQHSSGTTGLKKGVMLSYGAVLSQLDAYGRALDLTGTETVVSWLPVYHDMGLIACTLLPLVKGLGLVSMDPFEWLVQPHRLMEEAGRAQDALVWLPNFAFNHLARHARRLDAAVRLEGVRAFIDCSEPCRPDSFDAFAEAFAPHGLVPEQLQTCYAMAETVFAVTQTALGSTVRRLIADAETLAVAGRARPASPDRPSVALLSCGRPIEGLSIEIRDDTGRALDEGTVGEITLSGTSLFDGYFRQADLTAQRLNRGWFASRDLGFIQDGDLFVCGRKEDLIIIAGRNLYAHEVEALMAQIGGLRPGRSVAFGIDNAATGTEDLVVLAEVRTRLGQTLMVTPREVVILAPDTLIKTTSGKTSRSENRRRYLDGALTSWRDI